jgi:hypothetical protein
VGRRRAGGVAGVLASTLLLPILASCSVDGPAPDPTPTPTSSAQPSIPSGGVSLGELGIRFGPSSFSVPRGSSIATRIDQPNGVVLVLTSPAPAGVAAYLRRALPMTGFRVDQAATDISTFTFAGQGWRGSFTESAGTSAILLRPQ